MELEFLVGPLRRTRHQGDDDLLSAGLGLVGLAGAPTPFDDPEHPTAAELRRRAIQTGWKGIADLGPLGGFGQLYGAVPDVPGREYAAFARLPGASQPHRLLCQLPDAFDQRARCLLVAPSSGSRGIYGAMALAGGWGLARGCGVVYTDKGTGSGYFDCADGSGVALDGTRVVAGKEMLEFEPGAAQADAGLAVKHAHSGDHPEADWGKHVLQAIEFGLAMLDEAFPSEAPFTPENTRIIAAGLSNAGSAVLQAAGLDHDGWLDGVLALEPNVHVAESGRALYDYASDAALWMPAALTDASFDAVPFARSGQAPPPAWEARCVSLHEQGLVASASGKGQAAAALQHLRDGGWRDEVLATAAGLVAFGTWRAIAATYASAYLRTGVGDMPGGFSFRPVEVPGIPAEVVRQAWWADGTGIPPDTGIGLFGGMQAAADATLPGVLALRALWEGEHESTQKLHAAVDELAAGMPRDDLPVWVIHGAEDGLIPSAFTSAPYVEWLRSQGRKPRYWCIPHAQHFDAFLPMPGFGDRYVPLLPYGYFALERLYAHAVDGEPLPDPATPSARPRGAGKLEAAMLDLPKA